MGDFGRAVDLSYLRNATPDDVADFHTKADTDSGPLALHHTLGPRPYQAAAGNHGHDTVYAKRVLPAAHLASAGMSIPNSAFTLINNWSLFDYKGGGGDAGVLVSGTNYTIVKSGWYRIALNLYFAASPNVKAARILLNGSAQLQNNINNATNGEQSMQLYLERSCTAGWTVSFDVFQNSGAAVSITSARAMIAMDGET